MEQLCAIFPVVSEIILNNLDDQSLTNLKVASKDLNYFLDKEKCIPLRKITNCFRDVDFCSESWNKAVKRTDVDNVKKLAAAVEEFFKASDFSVTFEVLSPLEIAAHHGCLTFFKNIAQKIKKINILQNKVGPKHLLFIACKQGNLEMVKYLLSDCKFNVECKDKLNYNSDQTKYLVSPVWCAAASGKLEVVKYLIEFGANVNSESDTGSTPIRSACFFSHLEIVKFLVKNGGDIHRPNQDGVTCLINSVQSVAVCEYLLQSGANVNAQDQSDMSALHYAVMEKELETTKLLLRYGADPFIEDEWGTDALKFACQFRASEIFNWLVDHVPYTPERVEKGKKLLKMLIMWDIRESLALSNSPCP